jgi:hypothetical protein|tara:strand:+ start:2368 stop:2574 length:207 start_codon:yes stop_codon:yes gene_type:complete
MIRLPTPPLNIGAPAPVIDFYNKLNQMITFQQSLVKSLENQQTQNNFAQNAATKRSEDSAEAKGWFNG